MMHYTFQITNKSLDRKPMLSCWMMHELRQFIDSEGSVWPGQGNVLKAPNNKLIFRWISKRGAIMESWNLIRRHRRGNIRSIYHFGFDEEIIEILLLR